MRNKTYLGDYIGTPKVSSSAFQLFALAKRDTRAGAWQACLPVVLNRMQDAVAGLQMLYFTVTGTQ